ncbi:hypothetical protein K7432_000189 [Basidiobolus ranarum]|uniref:PCI domain-containing protein n=1 Tax=Basidiobolus ranarum TaxID=34480 RepID=A0ABR2X524_9FUNG
MSNMEEESLTKRKRTNKTIVQQVNNLDLDTYLANYKGHARFERLLFIAERCPPLQVEAYKQTLKEIQANSSDTNKYLDTLAKLNEVLISKGEETVSQDSAWIETTNKRNKLHAEKLEAELKNYKNNLIKESIRMGHKDLGDHYYHCGDLATALKCYSRTRDYCTTAKHITNMCMSVIQVSIEMKNFNHVQSFVSKAEAAPETQDKSLIQAKLHCSSGLAHLDSGRYKLAAKSFLDTSFELGSNYNEIIAPNDIAIYGGLCALATFDRTELKSKVISNTEFKKFLELEPHIRELILGFYSSKYTLCLEIMDKWKNDFLLDIYLHNHVEVLYRMIRMKALVQYFTPFQSVDLNKMAQSFSTTVNKLELEIASLIMNNNIQARIDSHNKILYAKRIDQRSHVFQNSIAMGQQYEKNARALLIRVKLLQAELIVNGKSDGRDY